MSWVREWLGVEDRERCWECDELITGEPGMLECGAMFHRRCRRSWLWRMTARAVPDRNARRREKTERKLPPRRIERCHGR